MSVSMNSVGSGGSEDEEDEDEDAESAHDDDEEDVDEVIRPPSRPPSPYDLLVGSSVQWNPERTPTDSTDEKKNRKTRTDSWDWCENTHIVVV